MSSRNRTALESLLSLLLGLGALGKHGHRRNVVDFRAKHLGSIILSVVRDLRHNFMATTTSVYNFQSSYLS